MSQSETKQSADSAITNGLRGTLYCRVEDNDLPGKYWLLGLSFVGVTELNQVFNFINERGWKPLDNTVDLLVNSKRFVELPEDKSPKYCPVHGASKLDISKRKAGYLYCKGKNADGSYCKFETPQNP